MRTKLKWIGIGLLAALGLFLALQNPPEPHIAGAYNCVAAKAIICLQR